MESSLLEFECIGIEDDGKIPIENTGRGQDISPKFVIKNLLELPPSTENKLYVAITRARGNVYFINDF